MGENRDEWPLMEGSSWMEEDTQHYHAKICPILLCCDGKERLPKWWERVRGSWESLLQKWRNFILNSKKSVYGFNQTKSGRFQYDPFSYALNFEEESRDEDEYSLHSFSARFAPPPPKPREAEGANN